ncbi:MAG: TetR/AcrR family transcriptional regulator [Desulfobacter sp.]|nr:MAG: TetR/AcrR family transcriptional regulator [Desulfobacter sp.]
MADPEKRKEILKAAAHCFAHFGFAKTTMDDIGAMVGLNKASLYYYYKNKEAIFCEIIEDEGQSVLRSLEEKIQPLPGWSDKIQAYFIERQQYLKQTANLHSLSVHTAHQLKFQPMFNKLASRFSNREKNLIKEILDKGISAGEVRPVDTQKTAAVILSVANNFKRERMENQNMGLEMEDSDYTALMEDTRFALDLILGGLKKSEPAAIDTKKHLSDKAE